MSLIKNFQKIYGIHFVVADREWRIVPFVHQDTKYHAFGIADTGIEDHVARMSEMYTVFLDIRLERPELSFWAKAGSVHTATLNRRDISTPDRCVNRIISEMARFLNK